MFFFMQTKVFVYLTHLKLSQISQTYLKIFIWLEHLKNIYLEYNEKLFLSYFHNFTKKGIFHNLSINVSSKK